VVIIRHKNVREATKTFLILIKLDELVFIGECHRAEAIIFYAAGLADSAAELDWILQNNCFLLT